MPQNATELMHLIDQMGPGIVRMKAFPFHQTSLTSLTFQEYAYTKKRDQMPTLARGIFLKKREPESWEVAVRGYDKFFNVGEIPETKWEYIEANCKGPFEVTLKENGCIIFIASVDGNLVVTSKHSMGPKQDGGISHAEKGREWLNNHLNRVGKSQDDLSKFLAGNNLTAVFEVMVLDISLPTMILKNMCWNMLLRSAGFMFMG